MNPAVLRRATGLNKVPAIVGDPSQLASLSSDQQAAINTAFSNLGAMFGDPSSLCSSGNGAVLAFQQAVNAALPGSLSEDGDYGPATASYAQALNSSSPAGCANFTASTSTAAAGTTTTLPTQTVTGTVPMSTGEKIAIAVGVAGAAGIAWWLFGK